MWKCKFHTGLGVTHASHDICRRGADNTVDPVFYVPLFYVKPVFYVTLSRTKCIFFMVSKLYFTGTSHLREENLVPWGHVKYRFHCTTH